MNYKIKIPNIHPGLKLLISLLAGVMVYFSSLPIHMEPFTRWMIGWDILGIVYISISIITLFFTHKTRIRAIAQKQDKGHQLLFVFMVMASITSLISIAVLIKANNTWILDEELSMMIYLTGVIVCWLMLHIIFTFRYAHMYYGDDIGDRSTHRGGLNIPGSLEPDYIDFAYFAFVIGMTFQVSDIVIVNHTIRRTVLFHSIIAFVFNTVIIALSVNAFVNAKF
jgi:uncharacterized membrane protein